MDFNLKHWREQHQQHESDQEQTQTQPAKLPRLLFHSNSQEQHPHSEALPLFVTEPTSKLSNTLSECPTPAATKYPTPRIGGSCFSLAQWQELELQALIFRHMLSGATVPPELLHLVKKSIITNSSHLYYFPHPLEQYPHFQQAALLQSGYWGRSSMDPEPGRCRRTDGKKWRCSRDVVAGQKYCERHMHRGRNRSRKPVEIPTHTTPNGGSTGNLCGGILKASNSIAAAHHLGGAMAAGGSGGPTTYSAFSGPSPSIDLVQLSQRSSEPIVESKNNASSGDGKSSGQILRHFFDDWPRRPLQENEYAGSNTRSATSTTNLSISISGNPTSDFSLKLSTGDGDNDTCDQTGNTEKQRAQTNWGAPLPWGSNHVTSMGGPLAEALRSSTSNSSSPTSVLHQLQRASASETSYVST